MNESTAHYMLVYILSHVTQFRKAYLESISPSYKTTYT